MRVQRRELLVACVGGLVGSAGCGSGGDGGDTGDQEEPKETLCTNARVTETDYEGDFYDRAEFHATVVNEGPVPGAITISLEFWQSEELENKEMYKARTFEIGAQETREMTMRESAPEDSNHYTMEVTDQACQS